MKLVIFELGNVTVLYFAGVPCFKIYIMNFVKVLLTSTSNFYDLNKLYHLVIEI